MQLYRLAGGFEAGAVELAEQIRQVVGDAIDDLQAQGVIGRQADRFAYRLFRPIGVASTQLRQAANVGSGVVDLLAGQGVLFTVRCLFIAGGRSGRSGRVLGRARQAADLHRRGRAEVGARGHHGDMAGVEDIGTGAGRPGATGGDESGYRHGAGENHLDDCAHRAVEPAGGIEADHHQLRLLRLGLLQAAHQIVGTGRADSVIDTQNQHRITGRCHAARQRAEHQ
ncbi:hypothetical protein D3C80_925910 [compost metagenome]